ncbi:uncharacterized protein [Branchiostoma lanceolatum]|uniref:uncharacterized protein n=1 Tax=Branchiostoma lanceolatum TaxID=7740 RepID=UPI00345256D8
MRVKMAESCRDQGPVDDEGANKTVERRGTQEEDQSIDIDDVFSRLQGLVHRAEAVVDRLSNLETDMVTKATEMVTVVRRRHYSDDDIPDLFRSLTKVTDAGDDGSRRNSLLRTYSLNDEDLVSVDSIKLEYKRNSLAPDQNSGAIRKQFKTDSEKKVFSPENPCTVERTKALPTKPYRDKTELQLQPRMDRRNNRLWFQNKMGDVILLEEHDMEEVFETKL